VFHLWRKLGLQYMFIGLEAIDEEGLRKHRKRVSLGRNFEALEFARSLGIMIAVNLIADPDWDHERFRIVREWGVELPEVINISVNTPYPGTESWATQGSEVASRDYRLYDIQHAVLPTRLPLAEFYDELVTTQRAFYRKHLGWRRLIDTAGVVAGHLSHGQTNFLRSLFLLDRVYRPELLLADHTLPVKYQMPLPRPLAARQSTSRALYIHSPRGRKDLASFVSPAICVLATGEADNVLPVNVADERPAGKTLAPFRRQHLRLGIGEAQIVTA